MLERERTSPSAGLLVMLAVVGLVCLALGGVGVWLFQRVTTRESAVPPPTPAESIPQAPGPDNTITTPPPKPAPETPSPRDAESKPEPEKERPS